MTMRLEAFGGWPRRWRPLRALGFDKVTVVFEQPPAR